jgi:hypothetical protein
MQRIEGVEGARVLINGVVDGLYSCRLPKRHVRYEIRTNNRFKLLTDEQGDTFRNVSIIDLNQRRDVVIGNRTGNMLVPDALLPAKTINQVLQFLEMIQPGKLADLINSSKPYPNRVVDTFRVDGEEITRTIIGSDGYSWEIVPEYITL